MSSEVWKARDRICGRMILVDHDSESGAVSAPELCPECGARLGGLDLMGPAGAGRKRQTSAAPTEAPGVGGSTIVTPAPVIVTTAALELAAQESIDLGSVKGSGSHGAITKADVLAAVAARTPPEGSAQK